MNQPTTHDLFLAARKLNGAALRQYLMGLSVRQLEEVCNKIDLKEELASRMPLAQGCRGYLTWLRANDQCIADALLAVDVF